MTSVQATWSVCGTPIASGNLPLFLNLPDPVAARVTISASRLTAVGDDASRSPIGVPTTSALEVVVDFDDGSSRTMTSDARITYSTTDPACAVADNGANSVTVLSSATCTDVMALATVQLGSFLFVVNHTRPVVYMDQLSLSFRGYPDTSSNGNLVVSTVGLLPCSTTAYFHATARVVARLSDSSTYTVTGQSTFSSSTPAVVLVSPSSSTRMQALSAGTSAITASFGARATTSSALTVANAYLDSAVSLSWSVPTVDGNNLELNSAVSTQVELAYASGLRQSDLASSTYDSWLDVGSLVSFTSAQPSALSVSSEGVVTLHDNYHAAVSLGASLSCSPSVFASTSRYANMRAAALDVDFGSLSGLQFAHAAGSAYLDIAVHVRPSSGTTLKAFQIKLGPLSSATLNSGAGATWSDGGTFSGIATQYDNPSTEVVLSASDTASTVSSQVTLGTVRLNVVGTGVTLIEGEIASLVVQDGTGANTEVQYAAVVAGRGYASITAGRRRMTAGEPQTPPAQLASRRGTAAPRSLQTTCDPCTARVWGDFNGDCQFLTSDVLALSEFVLSRERFEDGRDTADPLLSHVGVGGHSCDFLRTQANPSQDLMSQAGSNTADPRYGRPAITGLDTQHLLYATVKKYRFLTSMSASCGYSSVAGSAAQDMYAVVQLSGGDGQNAASIDASPTFTDVYFELRISPEPSPFVFDISLGALAESKYPAAGFTGGVGRGFVVQATSIGNGSYAARLQPRGGYSSGSASFQIAAIVETMTASGSKEVPASYKAWQGTSM